MFRQIEELTNKTERLQSENKELRAENNRLRAENRSMYQRIEKLETTFEQRIAATIAQAVDQATLQFS